MEDKTVSIIIPFYNAESTLDSCISSVIEQTYSLLEILLIDDGSRDKSLEIAKQYGQSDDRIIVLHHDNKGVSYTRNQGIEHATGEYIMFIDADDTVSPNWVERYVMFIVESNADIAIGGVTEIRPNGSTVAHLPPYKGVIGTEIWKYLCETRDSVFGYTPNKLYKREVIGNNRFDERMTVQEDLSFAVDVYSRSTSIVLIDEAGYYYRFEIGKRKTPFLDLISNQLKIFSYATPYIDQFNISLENLVRLIIGWSFQYLYETELDDGFIEKCKAARDIQEKYDFKAIQKPLNEKRIIYELLIREQYHIIKTWFVFRRLLKGIIS